MVLPFVMMRMLVLKVKLLGHEISREGDGRDAETGEGALEAVEACEGACVSPCFAVRCSVSWRRVREGGRAHYRAHGSPLVPFAEAAANFLGLKPVMEGRGAMAVLRGGG